MTDIPRNERLRLEAKAKSGWRAYFVEREKVYRLQEQRSERRDRVIILRQEAPRDVEYENLKRMFLDLYDKVGQLCDCSVCYNEMNKDNTCVPLCSHLICKACKERIDTCPICRKAY